MDKQSEHYIVSVIDCNTQQSIGVDFCKDEDELIRKANMFREDFGEGYIVLTHPSMERLVMNAASELARIDHDSRVAAKIASQQ